MTETISITQLPHELAKIATTESPPYRVIYARVLNGQLPAEQRNGRWFVRRDDIPSIAVKMGLTLTENEDGDRLEEPVAA